MSKAAELANLIGNINAGGGGVNRNVLINGAMNVKQRDAGGFTGVGGSAIYHLDRWKFQCANTAGRFSSDQVSDAPTGFANSLRLSCTTADTSLANTEQFIFQQKLEGQNVQAFAKGTSDAKPFALSFYVKGNASATYVAALYDEDNGRYVGKTFSVTTAWTRVEITFPADTTGVLDDDNASSLELWIWLHAGPTYKGGTLPLTWAGYSNANAAEGADSFFDSTSRTFFISGLQLEVGQNPTTFEHINNFGEELAKCQRYHFTLNHPERTTTRNLWMYAIDQSNSAAGYRRSSYIFPVAMRVVPTVTADFSGTGGTGGIDGGAWTSYNSVSFFMNGINSGNDYAYIDDLIATAEL